MDIRSNLKQLSNEIDLNKATLVAVSKTKPNSDVLQAYEFGHRDFGENKVQELLEKHESLPKDIHWHMIGHLQRNKVKYIAPFVRLIHAVDSIKLLAEINKQAEKHSRVIDCLLQVHIASEETKFGFEETELTKLFEENAFDEFQKIRICGLMGMATFTSDHEQVKSEFHTLKLLYDHISTEFEGSNIDLKYLSMGMSGDYKIALEEGSNMVRIGSSIFGERT